MNIKSDSINRLPYGHINDFQRRIKPNIFIPQSIADIENLDVSIEQADKELYFATVVMLSSFNVEHKIMPGRFMTFFAREKAHGKYLGIIALASDAFICPVRDNQIGWTLEHKTKGRLQNIVNCKTVIPFQSFGRNCLGGKLLTKLCQSKDVVNSYDKKYKDKTVLLTVQSLNPRPCQYNGIPNWKCVGDTKGDGKGNNKRPTFVCSLYENYKDFLCYRIEQEQLAPNGNLIDIQNAVNWWKPKAVERMAKRIKDGSFTTEETYFDSLYTKGDPTLGFIEF